MKFELQTEFDFLPDSFEEDYSLLGAASILYENGIYSYGYDFLAGAGLVVSAVPIVGPVLETGADAVTLLFAFTDVLAGDNGSGNAEFEIGMAAASLIFIYDDVVVLGVRNGRKFIMVRDARILSKELVAESVGDEAIGFAKKIFKIESDEIAGNLVNTLASNGESIFKMIILNDQMFDIVRRLPASEKTQFFSQMARNPNLLKSFYDSPHSAEHIKNWLTVNRSGHLHDNLRTAINAFDDSNNPIGEATLIHFYDDFYDYRVEFKEFLDLYNPPDIDVMGCWHSIRSQLDEFGDGDDAIDVGKVFFADLAANSSLVNYFRDNPILVRAWEVMSVDGFLRKHTESLEKVAEYLSYNPNSVNRLKLEFEATTFGLDFLDGFIGGPLRHNELDELNLLAREAADIYPQSLNTTKLQRKTELFNQLGEYTFISTLDNLSDGIPIRFKSEFFDPIENAYQTDGSWVRSPISVKNNRVYGITPLPTGVIDPFDFVITMDGELRVGLGHYYLSGNAPEVLAAGRLKITDEGKIWWIDFGSGHYRPGLDNIAEEEAIRNLLRNNNLSQFVGE